MQPIFFFVSPEVGGVGEQCGLCHGVGRETLFILGFECFFKHVVTHPHDTVYPVLEALLNRHTRSWQEGGDEGK